MARESVDVWMPLYIGDYLADTMHLSTEQHGAYLLLIMHQWRRGPIADDDDTLAAITRLPAERWLRARPILEEFFVVADGCWVQPRAARERSNAADHRERISAMRAEAGRRGGEKTQATRKQRAKQKQANGEANPQANPQATGQADPQANPGAADAFAGADPPAGADPAADCPDLKQNEANGQANGKQNPSASPSPLYAASYGSAPRATAVDLSIEARNHGIESSGSHPTLIAMASQGVTVEALRDAIETCVRRRPGVVPAIGYVAGMMAGQARDAAGLRFDGSGGAAPTRGGAGAPRPLSAAQAAALALQTPDDDGPPDDSPTEDYIDVDARVIPRLGA